MSKHGGLFSKVLTFSWAFCRLGNLQGDEEGELARRHEARACHVIGLLMSGGTGPFTQGKRESVVAVFERESTNVQVDHVPQECLLTMLYPIQVLE